MKIYIWILFVIAYLLYSVALIKIGESLKENEYLKASQKAINQSMRDADEIHKIDHYHGYNATDK